MFRLIVGNIGAVYEGKSDDTARIKFLEYKTASRNNYGRAAGEDVTLFENDEIIRSHIGTMNDN